MVVKTKEQIVTNRLEYHNLAGKKIVACWDHSAEGFQKKPFIIIPPAYGETKKNPLTLAYYLVLNGFNVIRYDATNHLGESDGEIFNYTFPQAKDDLISTMNFIVKKFSASQFGIVTTSLAVRVAIKAATEDSRISFIISLTGITNFRYTLQSIYYEDIIGNFLKKTAEEKYVILGHEVDSYFLEVAIKEEYHDLDTTIRDINCIRTPIVFIQSANDEWTNEEDIDKIINRSTNENLEKIVIPKAMHQLYENPTAAKAAVREAVVTSINFAYNTPLVQSQILEPDIKDLLRQNRVEKNWLKKYELTKQEEQQFWGKYLNQYSIIKKSEDYLQFLRDITKCLGEIHEGDIILDAGCGNGHFGLYIIHSMFQKHKNRVGSIEIMPPAFIYVGVDFVEGPLKEALIKHFGAKSKESHFNDFQKCFYFLQDLDPANQKPSLRSKQLLMFSNDFFDKICCSLLLSYVKDPYSVLKELFRVLKPGGKIVITSMKPHCDLSKIYRNYLQQIRTNREIKDARLLLNAAGKIYEKENIGYYQFFSEDQLKDLFVKSGGNNIRVYRSFGNQANVAVAEKQ